MSDTPFTQPEDEQESTADGGAWLLDLVAAVDHLRRGLRPGLTVWDALEEALRADDPDWEDPDPLRTALTELLQRTAGPIDLEIQGALRRWVLAACDRYNGGDHWPAASARRSFPPPAVGWETGGR